MILTLRHGYGDMKVRFKNLFVDYELNYETGEEIKFSVQSTDFGHSKIQRPDATVVEKFEDHNIAEQKSEDPENTIKIR